MIFRRLDFRTAAGEVVLSAPAHTGPSAPIRAVLVNKGTAPAWVGPELVPAHGGRLTVDFAGALPPSVRGEQGAMLFAQISVGNRGVYGEPLRAALRPVKVHSAVTTPNTGNAAARRLQLSAGCEAVAVDGYPTQASAAGVVYFASGRSTVDCIGAASAQGCAPAQSRRDAIPVTSPHVAQLTLAGVVLEGETFELGAFGVSAEYEAQDGDTVDDVAAGLVAALLPLVAAYPCDVEAAGAVVTLTALFPGVALQQTASTDSAGATATWAHISPFLSVFAGADFSVIVEEMAQ